MTNILLSPLGSNDPISNNHDGAMLHIYRNYDIDFVYLLDTGANKNLDKDDYFKVLNSVRELPESHFVYKQVGLKNPASIEESEKVFMDTILDFFSKIANIGINVENVYLNLSSGSFALQSQLYLIGQRFERSTMVQVMNPMASGRTKKQLSKLQQIFNIFKPHQQNQLATIDDLIKNNKDNIQNTKRTVEVYKNRAIFEILRHHNNGNLKDKKFLLVEGESDKNYIQLILDKNKISNIVPLPSGGVSGIEFTFNSLTKYFNCYALVDGDVNVNNVNNGKGELTKLMSVFGSEGIKVLDKLAVEDYLDGVLSNGKPVKDVIKNSKYSKLVNPKTNFIKEVYKPNTKINISKQATIQNIKELEKEILPFLKMIEKGK